MNLVVCKKHLPLPLAGLLLISALQINAQEPADALRFSWNVPGGTARQQAIGSAMGSLGGDISAIYTNPAGLGFYKTSDFVFTPRFSFNSTKSSFLDRTEKDNKNNFSIGTTGIVLGAANRRGNNIKSSAFSFAVNRSADFNSQILYRGQNKTSSYSQKFLEEIQNNNLKDANAVSGDYPFGTSLAFNTYWVDTIGGSTNGNFEFQSRAMPLLAEGLLQQNTITNSGGITEFALGGAANFNEKIYVGATLGIPILRYERESTFTEADPTDDASNKFNFASINENLRTKGVGLNLKAGIIFKPVEFFRVGLALHSPTFYSLSDNYTASVTTDTEGYQGEQSQTSDFLTGAPAQFKYMLMTPYRAILSASYVLHEVEDVRNQKGFLTADIEYINYKASSFSADQEFDNSQDTKDYLKSLNTTIDRTYKSAFNFRVGGELKFTTLMVRAGFAYYGNPYKNLIGEKGNRLLLSGGLGYRNKGMFIDLTYVHNMTKDVNIPYRLQYTQNVLARMKQTTGNAVLTIGFKI
jgi:long-subunit fatty acid transport protein